MFSCCITVVTALEYSQHQSSEAVAAALLGRERWITYYKRVCRHKILPIDIKGTECVVAEGQMVVLRRVILNHQPPERLAVSLGERACHSSPTSRKAGSFFGSEGLPFFTKPLKAGRLFL